MAKNIFDQDERLSIRLPWPTICRLAVAERCSGMSVERIIEQALTERLASMAASTQEEAKNG